MPTPLHVAGLLDALEARAPAALAEPWDNVGLLVGRRARPVSGVLVALDLRDAVLDEALARGCDAVLTHHPAIFPHLNAVDDQRAPLVLRAAEEGIALIAAHTNLDSAAGGLNDVMGDLLGMGERAPLRPVADDPAVGLGRVGAVEARSLGELLARATAAFVGPIVHTGELERAVGRVACCTGSGGSLIGDAVAAGADVYVTGDLKYHDADRSPTCALIGIPHAAVERVALERWSVGLAADLAERGVPLHFSTVDTDPWRAA